jgi:hypothetical protein
MRPAFSMLLTVVTLTWLLSSLCWVQAKGRLEKSMIGRGVMSQVRTSSGTSLFKRQVCCCALPVLHLANSNTNGAPSSGIAKRRSWTNFNKKHVLYLFICYFLNNVFTMINEINRVFTFFNPLKGWHCHRDRGTLGCLDISSGR